MCITSTYQNYKKIKERKRKNMSVDRCVMCGEEIPEGLQVCKKCAEEITGKDEVEELRDIAAVLKITAGTDKNIKTSMEALLRIADRLERERTK